MGRVRALLALISCFGSVSCGAESESPCADGDIAFRAAGEGCEECQCTDGAWSCEPWECVQPSCPPPASVDGDCASGPNWVRQPITRACCRYENLCVAPVGWQSFANDQAACQTLHCDPGARVPSGDGCNECVCDERGELWFCGDEPCSPDTPPPGKACGFFEGGCAAGEYCAFDPVEMCSSLDAPSLCRALPEACTDEDAPVCGCDQNSYGNRCLAAQAGTGIWDVGRCPEFSEDPACGAGTDNACTSDEYCAYDAGKCDDHGAQGLCRFRPLVCVAQLSPVCGCDHKSYANACEAAKAGVSVLASGNCS